MSETQTQTLAAWLLERIAEDEERAEFVRRQNAGPWHREFEPWRLSWHDEYDLLCIEPSRVLAECESKRRIVESEATPYPDGHCPATRTLRLLALPYADHPGFREEWRP